MLRVSLFGRPSLEVDGEPWRFAGPRRAWLLFCYLAVFAQQGIARDAAAFALWPDQEEEEARNGLRRELHRLHKALPSTGGPFIVSDDRALHWNRDAAMRFDTLEFERCIASGDPAAAVELYRGDLLEDVLEEWVFVERERFQTACFSALSDALVAARSRRNFEEAIGYATRTLAMDPFREDMLRTLMTLRYESGDRAGAIRDSQHYAKLYRTELGVGLMPETEALRESLVRGELRTVNASVAAVPEEKTVPSQPDFVGRERECDAGRAAFGRAADGQGTTLFVTGDAGIGKTRFVRELALHAERSGARVLFGSTSQPEREPYECIAEALRGALPLIANIAASETESVALATIVPEFARYVTAPSSVALNSSDRETGRLFAALEHYVVSLSRIRPLVLVFEDVHWARHATLSALRALAHAAPRHALLILATYRLPEAHDELRAEVSALGYEGAARRIPLSALGDEEMRHIVGAANVGDDDASRVLTFAAGNPFFAMEALQTIASGAPLRTFDGITETVDARLRLLSPASLDVAGVAANIGVAFSLDIVQRVSGVDERALQDAIGELIDRAIVRETIGRARHDHCFTHHLVRDVVYRAMPAEARRRRHYRIGSVLERDGETAAASEIALHFDAADAAEKAAAWYQLAAARAVERYANEEALAYLERALELETLPKQRFDILAARETVHARLGMSEARRGDISAMRVLAATLDVTRRDEADWRFLALHRRSSDAEGVRETLQRLRASAFGATQGGRLDFVEAEFSKVSGDPDRALELLEGIESQTQDDELRVEAYALIAEIAAERTDFERAQRYIGRARALTAGVNDSAPLIARTSLVAARSAMMAWNFGDAERFAREARDAYRVIGDVEGMADASLPLAAAMTRQLRFSQARATYDEALRLYERMHKPLGIAAAWVNRGVSETWLGNINRAHDAFTAAMSVFNDLNDRRGEAIAAINLSFIALVRAQYDEARRYAEHGVAIAASLQAPLLEALGLANLGTAKRELGDHQGAIADLERCVEVRQQSNPRESLINDLADLALAYLRADRDDDAMRLAIEILALAPQQRHTVWVPYALRSAMEVFSALESPAYELQATTLAREIFQRHLETLENDEARAIYASLPAHRILLEEATA